MDEPHVEGGDADDARDEARHAAYWRANVRLLAVLMAIWFAAQALVLWGCHRMRLWLARPFAA